MTNPKRQIPAARNAGVHRVTSPTMIAATNRMASAAANASEPKTSPLRATPASGGSAGGLGGSVMVGWGGCLTAHGSAHAT